MSKLISLVIPIHNEATNIPVLHQELNRVSNNMAHDVEIIFVNDGSQDDSALVIEQLAATDPTIKYIEFSRNFGKEAATSAGLLHAKGDAVVMMDADLQHPPELLPIFIEKWERGAAVVIGVRAQREKESQVKKLGSRIFYRIMNEIGETDLVSNATDYRLVDRSVVEEFNRFTERNRITRGLIDWLGFRREIVYFDPPQRHSGRPSYNYSKLYQLALTSFVSHSLLPLKLAGYLGLVITFIAGGVGFFMALNKYILGDPWGFNFSGPAMLAVFNLFLIGIVLSCLGLIALYIGFIHQEVQNRPMYISRRKINVE